MNSKTDGEQSKDIQNKTVELEIQPTNPPAISKRQLKKQKKQEKYLEKKEYMRSKRKEERKAKREQRVEAGLPPRPKKRKVEQVSSGVRVVLDLSFEKYMLEKVFEILYQELKSTAAQAMYCYSDNRGRETALDLYMTSVTGGIHEALIEKSPSYKNWKLNQHEKHFMELTKEEFHQNNNAPLEFCYLTADSPNVIADLDPNTIYIVGGIVDKNRHKGLCFQEAEKYKIGHGRLPIGEYIKLGTRKVLTINHVVAIMGEYVNHKDWKEAFLRILPARKGAAAKEDNNNSAEDLQSLSEVDDEKHENSESEIKEK
ncbi:tRNA methyltransferase 10 [Terramyces sp. JEL0728]|nr:tRNA methyltransferase 10 [Terramyces sp. JEL0728]